MCAALSIGTSSGEPVAHHLQHLCLIDGRIVPLHPISSLPQHPTNLPISHATDEFLPGGLIGAAVLNTCLGSIVEELIVSDPEGSIPGLVVCPTVVGVGGHRGGGGRLVRFNCSTDGVRRTSRPEKRLLRRWRTGSLRSDPTAPTPGLHHQRGQSQSLPTHQQGSGSGCGGRSSVWVVWFFCILQATPHRIRQRVDSWQIVTR